MILHGKCDPGFARARLLPSILPQEDDSLRETTLRSSRAPAPIPAGGFVSVFNKCSSKEINSGSEHPKNKNKIRNKSSQVVHNNYIQTRSKLRDLVQYSAQNMCFMSPANSEVQADNVAWTPIGRLATSNSSPLQLRIPALPTPPTHSFSMLLYSAYPRQTLDEIRADLVGRVSGNHLRAGISFSLVSWSARLVLHANQPQFRSFMAGQTPIPPP